MSNRRDAHQFHARSYVINVVNRLLYFTFSSELQDSAITPKSVLTLGLQSMLYSYELSREDHVITRARGQSS